MLPVDWVPVLILAWVEKSRYEKALSASMSAWRSAIRLGFNEAMRGVQSACQKNKIHDKLRTSEQSYQLLNGNWPYLFSSEGLTFFFYFKGFTAFLLRIL